MASNGSVSAMEQPSSHRNCSTAALSSPGAAKKVPSVHANRARPEVPTKPSPAGSKPRPPVPRKPPVASVNHEGSNSVGAPVPEPRQAATWQNLGKKQEACQDTPSSGVAPPPPLPQFPPNTPLSVVSNRSDMPSRPNPPRPRRSAPPVPPKKPAHRLLDSSESPESKQVNSFCTKEAIISDTTESSHTENMEKAVVDSRSYEQVFVEENSSEAVPEPGNFHSVVNGDKACDSKDICGDMPTKDCIFSNDQQPISKQNHIDNSYDILDKSGERETVVSPASRASSYSSSAVENVTIAKVECSRGPETAVALSDRGTCTSKVLDTTLLEQQEDPVLPVKDLLKKFAQPLSPSAGPRVRPKPRKRASLLKPTVNADNVSSQCGDYFGPDESCQGEQEADCPQLLPTPVQERKRQKVSEAETLSVQVNSVSVETLQREDATELHLSCCGEPNGTLQSYSGTELHSSFTGEAPQYYTKKQVSDSLENVLKTSAQSKDSAEEMQKAVLSSELSHAEDLREDGPSSPCDDAYEEGSKPQAPCAREAEKEEEEKDAERENLSEEAKVKDVRVLLESDAEQHELQNEVAETAEDPRLNETHSFTFGDVGETCGILKEIEALLNKRMKGGADFNLEVSSETEDTTNHTVSTLSTLPQRPPRPKRASKLKQMSDVSSVDSSSTESLTSVGLSTKKPCPPKPRRKNAPGSVIRSMSDVSGMRSVVDRVLDDGDDETPCLPPRQRSLRLPDLKPPPLPPRNKSMERLSDNLDSCLSGSEGSVVEAVKSCRKSEKLSSPLAGHSEMPDSLLRSATQAKNRKNLPRPTRQAPPPPPAKAGGQSLSMNSSQSSVTSKSHTEKVPQYSKIAIDALNATVGYVHGGQESGDFDDTNKSPAVVSVAQNYLVDHDYLEIPEDLAKRLAQESAMHQPPPVITKEETPPPDLPPRNYVGPSQEDASERHYDIVSESENIAEQPLLGESALHSGQDESRPSSFLETLGSAVDGYDSHHLRPASAISSSSSHSDNGSGIVDQPSSSDSEDEDGEKKLKAKREKKVFDIAEEVMKSEKVFVDVLRLLNVDFRVFVSQKTEEVGHAVVPSETLNKILDYLPQLQSFNEVLLKDLKERIDGWEQNQKISDIFVKKGPFLKLYSSYIRNFEHATALLDETCKKHHEFQLTVLQFERTPKCANLALKHYMLKPIQRIPQYKLLLQNYLNQLTPESTDYRDTIVALNIVSEVADHANESMRHGDNVQKLLEVQRSLIGQFEVIQPGRVLIKRGELQKLSRKVMQPRMFFLFNDVLLYTTPVTAGYRLNNVLPLNGMKVVPPKLEEFKNEFNIITTHRSFTVATSTPSEREEWLNALWNAIDENAEKYHTFKSLQQEPQNSLMDKDFVLGHKAPLWIPDARVTMCMLCMTEFSITWRRHHCRACGRIICGNCSENRAPLRYLMYKPARVCDDCFQKLEQEVQNWEEKEKTRGENSSTSTDGKTPVAASQESPLIFSSIKARFQKIHKSKSLKKKPSMARPSVLVEVHANDEGSAMSGYLWVAKNKKWKRLWFVVKGSVLYTYKASEDVAAIESMPLLGFEVTRMTTWYQGAEPDLMFELKHQNTQPLVFKSRSSTGGDPSGAAATGPPETPTSPGVIPHMKSSSDTTTPRLIFRTDSAAATTKWVTVLREASVA
ncbi:FYVE, RhoGEF and PH domain-containing protein 6-like isoform X3 [Pomacea canaliculata]|uniref:FYVE, RhoGEF and PH domain-containing protein 6-like isoform X3 n=1 Tax=Pomacea canaliculata TaxID=400727 RepID=UPI000D73E38B|nr:FYVE, RhoGEF and PH domain-containing protein 6-like isoform X3 [Pomacea canaliculata]